MNTPVLDNRTKADLLRQIAELAAEYVPEWRCALSDTEDPGAALAELFAEMFYETVDRFNAVPQRLYTEYLNLLGVEVPPVTPAAGLIRFQVHEGVEESVPVPAGSLLYASRPGEDPVIYETERFLSATPAVLDDVYYLDTEAGVIQRLDLSREQPFFAPTDGENLQRHQFDISQNDVLAVNGPCTVELQLESRVHFQEEGIVRQLASGGFARWTWQGADGAVPFDEVQGNGNRLLLTKRSPAPLLADADGRIRLRCEMGVGEGRLELDRLTLRSAPLEDLPADSLAHNDIPIAQGEGGYCFGQRPAPYELFYIQSDAAFSKRGATACVKLEIVPEVQSEVDGGPQYMFNRRIIDKSEAVTIQPDDVFVREVVWEYYNGRGWARLEVEGNRNPFSCQEQGALELRFTVPEDIQPVLVNAREGGYIRARVVTVENMYSTVPRWILPFVKTVSCTWQYNQLCPADWLESVNNADRVTLSDAAGITELRFPAYDNLERAPRAMYFRFDRPLQGTPISMMFDVVGDAPPPGKILYEAWQDGQFMPLQVLDDSRNLEHSGPVYLYLPNPTEETAFFGERGHWLRMSLTQMDIGDRTPPRISGIRFNVTTAVQRQWSPEQRFSTGSYEANKYIRLMETPVQACELWIDEAGGISAAELEELERTCPEEVRVTREENTVTSCLVRWHQAPLAQGAPGERIFQLDSHTGLIRFGDGKNGRVPPAGFENIHVRAAYGGGSQGNLPEGAVQNFLVSVPRISALENITPMGGGTDRMATSRVERLGGRRIRHRGRAVGVRDYEDLIAEHFNRVAHVKGFPGLDEKGQPAPGHLSIVVMGDGQAWLDRELCDSIRQFLQERGDCTMIASGRLHVLTALELTIHVRLWVRLRDLEQAAATQQELLQTLEQLIDQQWRSREIGQQIRIDEVYSAAKSVPNVESVTQALIEGVWQEDGRTRICPIEGEVDFPYAVVRSGTHLVRIQS